jgi:hypothetical protein
MYEWSSKKNNLILITGHTHTPVFASGRYNDHPNNVVHDPGEINKKNVIRPGYFNSGCCCYNDGDITGIEIGDGKISLIRWKLNNNISERSVLEEISLVKILEDL